MAKKSYESKIGKIIYGALLFMPLISIGVKCLYVVCNKNAYQSYYGENINEKNEKVIAYSDIEMNNEYYLKTSIKESTSDLTMTRIYFSNIQDLDSNIYPGVINNGAYLNIVNNSIIFYNASNTAIQNVNITTETINIKLTITALQLGTAQYPKIYTYEYNKYSYMDNVFEYSISQVEENSLYNWSKNTAIYDGVETTTNLLGITHSFYPMLLTYWLLITIIYIIYDIALIMVLLAHKKVHSLIEKD